MQILADGDGNVVHLYDRDCSVQLRNQKVVEVAPGHRAARRAAPAGSSTARSRSPPAAGYVNAGTVEFLVSPERGAFAFIELNPRIQVEHTVTEEVDRRRPRRGPVPHRRRRRRSADLGLADQAAVGTPRGVAVQARVVATGTGTLDAYREPSGPGVRVDGAATPATPRRRSSIRCWPR